MRPMSAIEQTTLEERRMRTPFLALVAAALEAPLVQTWELRLLIGSLDYTAGVCLSGGDMDLSLLQCDTHLVGVGIGGGVA